MKYSSIFEIQLFLIIVMMNSLKTSSHEPKSSLTIYPHILAPILSHSFLYLSTSYTTELHIRSSFSRLLRYLMLSLSPLILPSLRQTDTYQLLPSTMVHQYQRSRIAKQTAGDQDICRSLGPLPLLFIFSLPFPLPFLLPVLTLALLFPYSPLDNMLSKLTSTSKYSSKCGC
jgi:hypothetical protein